MIAAVVQARMSSRRLPGKVLRRLGDKRMLEYVLDRLEHADTLDRVVVATSVDSSDDPVAELCQSLGVPVVRGPLDDVAGRFLNAVDELRLDAFVRISADSPLIDQRLVDHAVRLFREGGVDMVTNVMPSTFPSGQSVEVVGADAFRRACAGMTDPAHREHVTLAMREGSGAWRVRNFERPAGDAGHLDLSVDNEEDAARVAAILASMDRPHWDYSCEEVVELYRGLGGRAGDRRLRAAVIGLGVGEQHAVAYDAHPGCELAALCDFDADRLARVGAKFPGAALRREADEVLCDPSIDVVSIASWDNFHFDQVRQALLQRKHVFVEKPLCLHDEEAEELWRLHRQHSQLVLSSNLVLRASPRFQELKAWIDTGRLGRIYYLEGDYDYGRLQKITEGWRGDLPYYSVTLGGTVHLVDLLLWFMGDDQVARVTARGNRIATAGTKFRFDDLVVAVLELESGALAKVSANFAAARPHFHRVSVYGTDGTWENGPDAGTLWTRDGAGGFDARPVSSPYPGVQKGALIESFLAAVAGGPPAAGSADDVFRPMAVCLAIERSAATGRTVEVKRFGHLMA